MIMLLLNPQRMSLTDVAKSLGNSTKNLTTTKKWLEDNGICYASTGCLKGVSQWQFEFVLQLKLVEDLKIQFPSLWYKIYEAGSTDENMVKAVFVLHPPVQKTSRNKLNKSEVDFLKRNK